MPYSLFRELIDLTEEFEENFNGKINIANFSGWLYDRVSVAKATDVLEPDWDGKADGRSANSVINTSFVRLFRYAKIYSKLAIASSPFATIDEVIFLLNLHHRGSMTKIQLIELNIHEKSTGIQIINRLLQNGFIAEEVNVKDKRSKKVYITEFGKAALDENMDKVRNASKLVVGNLNQKEKVQLIRLLQKLEDFHQQKIKRITNPTNLSLL